MELEELRQRIRDWKQRTQGIAPEVYDPDAAAVSAAPVSYDAAETGAGDEDVVDIDSGPVAAEEYVEAAAPVEAEAPMEAEAQPEAYGSFEEAEPVEDFAVEEEAPVVAAAATPVPSPPPSPAPEEDALAAAETAARLGVDLSVPEGESTAEIIVPGEDGADPDQGPQG